MPKGQWSRAAHEERYAAARNAEQRLAWARDYAVGHGLKEKATLKTGLFPDIGRNKLGNAIRGRGKLASKDHKPVALAILGIFPQNFGTMLFKTRR